MITIFVRSMIDTSCFVPGPNFVSSLAYDDYVFFFYRETAVEYMNCGKVSEISERVTLIVKHSITYFL